MTYPLATQHRMELCEDVEWLLDVGTSVTDICARVNTTPRALVRRLYRANRPDLATRVWAGIDQAVKAAWKRRQRLVAA